MTSKQLRITSDLLNSPLIKNAVGFDRMINEFFETANTGGYPPYNSARITDEKGNISYEIVLAVAGFTEENISITVENDQLHITGQSPVLDQVEGYHYMHKGIAERKFTRSFPLDKHVEVRSASLENGLLTIILDRIVPEEKKPKMIPINKTI